MRLVFLAAVVFALGGCADLKGLMASLTKDPQATLEAGKDIVKYSKDLAQAVDAKDYVATREALLNLQVATVTLSGATTVREEYGDACIDAVEAHLNDLTLGEVRIVRASKLIAVIEAIGPLSHIEAMTIDRVIYVGKGEVLPLVHELTHVPQWGDEKFEQKYIASLLIDGYDDSPFEETARALAVAFTDRYGVVCDLF